MPSQSVLWRQRALALRPEPALMRPDHLAAVRTVFQVRWGRGLRHPPALLLAPRLGHHRLDVGHRLFLDGSLGNATLAFKSTVGLMSAFDPLRASGLKSGGTEPDKHPCDY